VPGGNQHPGALCRHSPSVSGFPCCHQVTKCSGKKHCTALHEGKMENASGARILPRQWRESGRSGTVLPTTKPSFTGIFQNTTRTSCNSPSGFLPLPGTGANATTGFRRPAPMVELPSHAEIDLLNPVYPAVDSLNLLQICKHARRFACLHPCMFCTQNDTVTARQALRAIRGR